MLGWLFPRPPLRPWEKAWTEYRFSWLIEAFGVDRLRKARIALPDDKFFPDVYDGRPEDAEAILRRLCTFMEVPPERVRFEVLSDDNMRATAGHYDANDPNNRPVIRLAHSQLENPESVVATLAHELAHELLLGGGLMTGEEADHEWVTDLLPAFLGLGIFAANSTVRISSGFSGTWHWWRAKRQGYLPSRMHGYALALFTWLRGDGDPIWISRLRLDARSAMKSGLRYLRRTGDCHLQPDALDRRNRHTPQAVERVLARGSPSARIVAMWEARDRGDASLAPKVRKLLRHRTPDVRAEAVRVLTILGVEDPQCAHHLVGMLRDHDGAVCAAAASAMAKLQPNSQSAVWELGNMLSDASPEVVRAAARALRCYGSQARSAENQVLQALHRALIDCRYSLIDLLIDTLRHVAEDAGASINDYFRQRDQEFRQAAVDALYGRGDSSVMHSDDEA